MMISTTWVDEQQTDNDNDENHSGRDVVDDADSGCTRILAKHCSLLRKVFFRLGAHRNLPVLFSLVSVKPGLDPQAQTSQQQQLRAS